MDLYTRSLLAVSILAATSIPIVVTPGGAPVVFSLVNGGAGAGHNGALPPEAFARVQKLNSLGEFNDVYFIDGGRDLSIALTLPGTYRVVKGETGEGSAFGVDITSADFALAPPGDPGPGVVGGPATTSDPPAPFPTITTSRQTYMDDGQSMDLTTGILVKRVSVGAAVGLPEGSAPFPPLFPSSGAAEFTLMRDGYAFEVTVALQMDFPPPRSDHAD